MNDLKIGSIVLLLLSLGFVLHSLGAEAEAMSGSPLSEPIDYVIVITGGELLRGLYSDSHTQFITRTLEPLGTRCVASLCVGDKRGDLVDALSYAKDHARLIIVTGGLGPTDDDVTRETVSEFTHISLREHPEVRAKLERRFSSPDQKLRENVRRQARTPSKGDYLPNPNGTAVGLVFDRGDLVVVALPGPPGELRPIVTDAVVPFLSKRFGTHPVGSMLQMRFVGIGESRLNEVIHQHLSLPDDLMISSLFEKGRVDLTFSLPGNGPDESLRLKGLQHQLMEHIGEYMYSDDGSSLEERVLQMLVEHKITLSAAEVGSGGAIAANLAGARDAAQSFHGGYVAASNRKMTTMLQGVEISPNGDPTGQAMAQHVLENLKTKWGLAVTSSIEPDTGPAYVWVSFGSRESGFVSEKISLRGEGQAMRERLVTSVLDLIRKRLQALP